MNKFGGNKGAWTQPGSTGNQKIEPIVSQPWECKAVWSGAKHQNTTIVWGMASAWTHDFLLLEPTLWSLWALDSQCCWELWYRNKSNFLNSFQKKKRVGFLHLQHTMNGFAEIQTLVDGFSKPICFYHLPLVKSIKYSPNKSRGPGCHWSFYSGLQCAQRLLEMSVTHGDARWDHAVTWCCEGQPGTAHPEEHKKHARRPRPRPGPPSLSVEEKSCALFKGLSAGKGCDLAISWRIF